MKRARQLVVVLCAGVVPAAAASADILYYQNNFEAGVLEAGWGHTARIEPGPAAFTKFVGRYSENTPTILNNSVSLTLPRVQDDTGNPGEWAVYTLNFDFYAIDRWRGSDATVGPDKMEVYINSQNMWSYTFSNTTAGQTYGAPDQAGFLGYNAADRDSIYRNISIPFELGTATQMVIKWRSDGLTGINNESWGIDNVRITYTMVPSPGSLALLGLGGVALAGRPRRRA